jgi:hypothetical protein
MSNEETAPSGDDTMRITKDAADLRRAGRWVVVQEHRGLWSAFGHYATEAQALKVARNIDGRVLPPTNA